jgi:pyrroloquinoline-quinone synthase
MHLHMLRPKAAPRRLSLLESIDQLIETHHLLKHPFYRAWEAGTLSRESLQLYAEQYYQHVRAFPDNLKEFAGRTSGPLADLVEQDLAEEVNPSAPHSLLWRQFAESLGVSEAALNEVRPLPGVAALLDTYDEIASQGTQAQAAASFYAYESQMPEMVAKKKTGLCRHYNITEPRALAYFEVREKVDSHRREAWRRWLGNQHNADKFGVMCAVERSLRALWGALDAVYPPTCQIVN